MRLFFIGDTWQGSSARSMREGLALQPGVLMSDIGPDQFSPRYRKLPLRLANRVLKVLQFKELESAVLDGIAGFRPDAVVVYKGSGLDPGFLKEIRRAGIPLINVFPDYSPHAYGRQLQEAMGYYDLVISTKPFHPSHWESVYGYNNPCVFVPHGYDPAVHYWDRPSHSQVYDVALCGSWRPEYHRLMRSFAEALDNDRISVAIAGGGWLAHRDQLPSHWQYVGPRTGRAYGEFLRAGRIAIAPVNREVVIRGAQQPGDEDTTRTYELAAAQCFFLHQRTDYLPTVYDENDEVPLWRDAAELAQLVQRWLPDEAGRQVMAAKAHARAVPAYSIPQRAAMVLEHIKELVSTRPASNLHV